MVSRITKIPLTRTAFIAAQKVLAAADYLRKLEQHHGFTAEQADEAVKQNSAYLEAHPPRKNFWRSKARNEPEPITEITPAAKQRNELLRQETLLQGWSKVIRVHYQQHRRDGVVETHDRDLLNRGDGIAVLLHNPERDAVLLVRQPRIVATMRGDRTGETIEVCCGGVGNEDPLEAAIRETHEELGHRVSDLELLGTVYAASGISLELVSIYYGEYDESTKANDGGGLLHEGEDIEVLEVATQTAIQWASDGTIQDARSVLAIQFALLKGKLS